MAGGPLRRGTSRSPSAPHVDAGAGAHLTQRFREAWVHPGGWSTRRHRWWTHPSRPPSSSQRSTPPRHMALVARAPRVRLLARTCYQSPRRSRGVQLPRGLSSREQRANAMPHGSASLSTVEKEKGCRGPRIPRRAPTAYAQELSSRPTPHATSGEQDVTAVRRLAALRRLGSGSHCESLAPDPPASR